MEECGRMDVNVLVSEWMLTDMNDHGWMDVNMQIKEWEFSNEWVGMNIWLNENEESTRIDVIQTISSILPQIVFLINDLCEE